MSPAHSLRASAGMLAPSAVLCGMLLGALPAQAAFFNNGSGLASPGQTVDFEGPVLVPNQVVTNEFHDLGVDFTGAYGNPDPSEGYPNITGNRIGNFQGGVGGSQRVLMMNFTQVLQEAAFALVTASGGSTTFQAYLGTQLVEEATLLTDNEDPLNYYGFTGIRFDRVALSVVSFNTALMIDNLQSVTAVPEPGSAGLLVAGLGTLAGGAWRRRVVERRQLPGPPKGSAAAHLPPTDWPGATDPAMEDAPARPDAAGSSPPAAPRVSPLLAPFAAAWRRATPLPTA